MVCGYLLNGLAVFAATEGTVMPLKVKVIFQQNILQNIEDVGGSLEVSVVLEAPDQLVVLEHGDQLHLGPVVLAVAVHAEAALVLVVLEVGHLTLAVPLHVPVEPLAGVVGAEHLDILQHVEVGDEFLLGEMCGAGRERVLKLVGGHATAGVQLWLH